MNKKTLIILLQSLFILMLIWLLWVPYDSQRPSIKLSDSGSPSESRELNELIQRIDTLETEIKTGLYARQQLEDRLFHLEQERLKTTLDLNSSLQPSSPSASSEVTNNPQKNDLSIQQQLFKQGLPTATVGMIKDYIDSRRLQRLQLRNQAIRNGWEDSDEFIEKMYQLNDVSKGLRKDFGEKVYDHYLYASGQPNRVKVREIIGGSVAESAGIKAGDIILRYANEPIYNMLDLRKATAQGAPGEGTLVELLRDKQFYSLTIPRGPLGILMDYSRQQPKP